MLFWVVLGLAFVLTFALAIGRCVAMDWFEEDMKKRKEDKNKC